MKKSKTSAARTKRPQQMTKEELIATLLKKKQCNAKALSVVERMLESDVNPQWLLDSLQFISQSHYQDAVEERVILKVCGYPLCKNPFGNIPRQQFRISTQNNKVYDISERKNFCSNGCYRSSSFLKNQIMTSPLWLRDIEKVPEYKLLDGGSSRGGVGDEIDVGPTRVTAQEASPDQNTSDKTGGLSQEKNEKCQSTELDESLQNDFVKTISSQNCAPLTQSEHYIPIQEKQETLTNIDSVKDNIACGSSESFNTLKEEKDPETMDSLEQSFDQQEWCPPVESCSGTRSISTVPRSLDSLQTVVKAVEIDDKDKQMTIPAETPRDSNIKSQALLAQNIEEKSYTKGIESNTIKRNFRVAVECKERSNLGSTEINKLTKGTDENKKVEKQKRKSRHEKVVSVAMPSVSEFVEERLTEWFTVDSLFFLYGEQRTREMLGQLDGDLEQNFKPLDSATWDPEKHERFVNICKTLNLLDLEDKSYDEKVINEDKLVVKKPLPDFNKLKEEAEKMDLRVQAFYKGQLELEPRKVTFAEDMKKETEDSELPIIPLVHQHGQRALRRRLVLDSLNRVLPDLLRTIGVQSSQVNSALRGLVGTFALTASNITFNPRQWTLVAIAIIKLLSVREARLHHALASEASQKYLTLIQMSYNLGPTFLDLLMDRLVSSAIVPTKSLETS